MKSDIPIYFLAVLLGVCAGTLELTVGDLLVTALFVLLSTLVLGFLRPVRASREASHERDDGRYMGSRDDGNDWAAV